jgi:hypothetical protein
MVQGKIVIGSGDKAMPIPISTTLPPDKPGTFVFDYTADKPEEGTHLSMNEFADWVGKNFGQGVLDTSSLPQGMQTLEVALKRLHLETTGTNLQLAVLLGGKSSDSKWKSEWKPIANFPLTLVDVVLEIKQV